MCDACGTAGVFTDEPVIVDEWMEESVERFQYESSHWSWKFDLNMYCVLCTVREYSMKSMTLTKRTLRYPSGLVQCNYVKAFYLCIIDLTVTSFFCFFCFLHLALRYAQFLQHKKCLCLNYQWLVSPAAACVNILCTFTCVLSDVDAELDDVSGEDFTGRTLFWATTQPLAVDERPVAAFSVLQVELTQNRENRWET